MSLSRLMIPIHGVRRGGAIMGVQTMASARWSSTGEDGGSFRAASAPRASSGSVISERHGLFLAGADVAEIVPAAHREVSRGGCFDKTCAGTRSRPQT